jgi:hypothetical protein
MKILQIMISILRLCKYGNFSAIIGGLGLPIPLVIIITSSDKTINVVYKQTAVKRSVPRNKPSIFHCKNCYYLNIVSQ